MCPRCYKKMLKIPTFLKSSWSKCYKTARNPPIQPIQSNSNKEEQVCWFWKTTITVSTDVVIISILDSNTQETIPSRWKRYSTSFRLPAVEKWLRARDMQIEKLAGRNYIKMWRIQKSWDSHLCWSKPWLTSAADGVEWNEK